VTLNFHFYKLVLAGGVILFTGGAVQAVNTLYLLHEYQHQHTYHSIRINSNTTQLGLIPTMWSIIYFFTPVVSQ